MPAATGCRSDCSVLPRSPTRWPRRSVAPGSSPRGSPASRSVGRVDPYAAKRRGRWTNSRCIAETTGDLLTMMSFLIFGIFLGPVLAALTWQMVVYGVVSLAVVRLAAVALAVIRNGMQWPTVLYIGWFGPRGLATLILTIEIIRRERTRPRVDDRPNGVVHGRAQRAAPRADRMVGLESIRRLRRVAPSRQRVRRARGVRVRCARALRSQHRSRTIDRTTADHRTIDRRVTPMVQSAEDPDVSRADGDLRVDRAPWPWPLRTRRRRSCRRCGGRRVWPAGRHRMTLRPHRGGRPGWPGWRPEPLGRSFGHPPPRAMR